VYGDRPCSHSSISYASVPACRAPRRSGTPIG